MRNKKYVSKYGLQEPVREITDFLRSVSFHSTVVKGKRLPVRGGKGASMPGGPLPSGVSWILILCVMAAWLQSSLLIYKRASFLVERELCI